MGPGDIDALRQQFRAAFPDAGPPQICLAPGRVNLLGEHLDYNKLPVLPMTIDRHIGVAFAPLPHSVVRVYNSSANFDDGQFINSDLFDDSRPGHWQNYCQAAIHTLNEHFKIDHYPGMAAAIHGDIPPESGLSSSSALVVAFAIAYLRILNKRLGYDISREELASLLAQGERLVGVPGGGMDQAMALLGKAASATKMDFDPLRMEELPLFPNYTFVVSDTLISAKKSGSANAAYSQGPALCRILTALLQKHLQQEIDPDLTLNYLADIWYGDLCLTHNEAAQLFDRVFATESTPLSEVAHRLKLTPEVLREKWLKGTVSNTQTLPLRPRARHQRTEYRRVEEGRDALIAKDPEYFGQLMTASHASCAEDYDVSCPELDKLVEVALEAGALGARLTGAGFGGCTISLVLTDRVPVFMAHVRDRYYRDFREVSPPPGAIFAAMPSSAADYC